MELPALLSRYLLASASEQAALRASHANIFAGEVVDALAEAHALMHETQQAARAACSAVDDVAGSLDLPAALSVCDAERHALGLTDEAMAARFAEHIALLLQSSGNESAAPPLWHQQRSIVLAVLSFLPLEATLSVADSVCGTWRHWLGGAEGAQAFWYGCVQREFPRHLQALVESEGTELQEADWGNIALLCCAVAGEAEEEEED